MNFNLCFQFYDGLFYMSQSDTNYEFLSILAQHLFYFQFVLCDILILLIYLIITYMTLTNISSL